MINTETVPGGCRPLDQANRLEPQAHLKSKPVNHTHHHRRRHQCIVIEDRSVTPVWPRVVDLLHRSAGGVLLLSLRSLSIHRLLGWPGPTHHRHLLSLLSPKADTHFTVPWSVEGWVDLIHADAHLWTRDNPRNSSYLWNKKQQQRFIDTEKNWNLWVILGITDSVCKVAFGRCL